MISGKKLEELQKDDRKVTADELQDILDVEIRGDTPTQRLESFLGQIGDPYHFRVGKTVVKVRFNESGKTLENILKTYFLGLKC